MSISPLVIVLLIGAARVGPGIGIIMFIEGLVIFQGTLSYPFQKLLQKSQYEQIAVFPAYICFIKFFDFTLFNK